MKPGITEYPILFEEKLIQKAFEKVCYKRRDYGCNNDIWELRFNWGCRKSVLLEELNTGIYRFDAVREVIIDGEMYEIWAAQDAVVLEALTMLLKDKYNITKNCSSYHLKGRGGVKAAVNKAQSGIKKYKYFYKSDIKKYYASIDHDILLDVLRNRIPDRRVISLLYQFLKRTRYRDGYYKSTKQGICRGSSLSPIIGALYLGELDKCMKNTNSILYCRYMDDWFIMCDHKWKFKRIIKKVFRILETLKLKIAYEKTMVGRTSTKCFDFLGFNIGIDGLRVAKKSVRKFAENVVLRLISHSNSTAGKNTRSGRVRYGENSRVYDSWCLRANPMKGALSFPHGISKYVERWLRRVKSVYGKHSEIEVLQASPL
jgi:RNA-directed DNA polymerase